MRYIKKYESFSEIGREVIIILGLPGSGKTTLAKQLISENPSKNFIHLDDGKHEQTKNYPNDNIIVSDGYLIGISGLFENFIQDLNNSGIRPEIYIFDHDEMSMEKCKINILNRKEYTIDPKLLLPELPWSKRILESISKYVEKNKKSFGKVIREKVYSSSN